jgi:hypothetical protein
MMPINNATNYQTTQHDVLVGAANNLITNIAPTSTSGIPLVSNGTSSDPSFTTAVVAGGGTGNTTFTAYSVITAGTAATGAFQNVVGVGSSGNVLTSNGAAALPTWQAVSGPGGLTYVTLNITSAQIKALHGTPIAIVAAPGSGKVLQVLGPVYAKFNYGGTNVFTAAASQTIDIIYGTATDLTNLVNNGIIVGTTSEYTIHNITSPIAATLANTENLALNLYNPVSTEISGNAANNNTVTVSFFYATVTLT